MVRYATGDASEYDVLDSENPRVELETRHTQVVGYVNLVEATPQARKCLERQSRHDLNRPWSTRPDSFAFLWTALRVYDVVSIPSLGFCVLLAALYAVQLECTKKANAECDGYWLPLDFCVFEGGIEP